MDYFVEQGATDQEVQSTIRRKYGDRVHILSRREVRTGGVLGLFQRSAVEVTGYCSHAPVRPAAGRGSAPEERLKILEQARTLSGRPAAQPEPDRLESVLEEIRSLRAEVGRGALAPASPPLNGTGSPSDPSALQRLREVLEDNDFSPAYITALLDRVRREVTLDTLEDFDAVCRMVVSWIMEDITIFPWKERGRKPHVVVLVGPTGVGKTTTIAKLAAMYGAVADPPQDVRIITIDTYRIGALQQIQKYGEIMNIPVTAVESVQEMEKQLALSSDADFVFVDTIGKSPHDLGRLAEVNQLVRAAHGEVHLAVSATTKRTDIVEIMRQFEPFDYQSVVVTKVDETASVGGILSALQEKRKSVSFFTDGQSVPQDIERARKGAFIRRLRDMPGSRELAGERETAAAVDPSGGSND